MRLIEYVIFITLTIIATSFGYSVEKVILSDQSYPPLPDNMERIYGGMYSSYTKASSDVQIATITLSFSLNEIGNDGDAVILLAKKEAAKLGANWIYYVSGTTFTKIGAIASETYRCVRTSYVDYLIAQEELKYDKTMAQSEFVNKIQFYTVYQSSVDSLKDSIALSKLNIIKIKTKDGIFYKDTVNNIKYSKIKIKDRLLKYKIDYTLDIYRTYQALFIEEYPTIQMINQKYPKAHAADYLTYYASVVNDSLLIDTLKAIKILEYNYKY